jgi:uncharacterized protein with PhoU and TrkA domain
VARTRVTFTQDTAGVREVLQSTEMHDMVDEAAQGIADRVRGQVPDPGAVEVHAYTTDREAARVTVADRRAMGWQARDGLLTRAAAAQGAEVKERDG